MQIRHFLSIQTLTTNAMPLMLFGLPGLYGEWHNFQFHGNEGDFPLFRAFYLLALATIMVFDATRRLVKRSYRHFFLSIFVAFACLIRISYSTEWQLVETKILAYALDFEPTSCEKRMIGSEATASICYRYAEDGFRIQLIWNPSDELARPFVDWPDGLRRFASGNELPPSPADKCLLSDVKRIVGHMYFLWNHCGDEQPVQTH